MESQSRCSELSRVSRTSSVMPMIEFIGVRISWLMLARKADFVRFAASAASFAVCSSRSCCFWTLMSSTKQTHWFREPSSIAAPISTGTRAPSCRRNSFS
jgi:hypothetical protein